MNSKTVIKQLKEMEKYGRKMRLAAEEWNSPWEILIATILSARTRDEKTIPIAEKLFKKYKNASQLSNAKISEVEKIIRPINFYKNKSKNIVKCSRELVENYNSKIPLNENELVKLSGVGLKTANVFLSEIGKDAIGVDTHVSYISQKLKWTKNKSPEKIKKDLEKLFPKKHWRKINSTLVRLGKTYTSKKRKDEVLDNIGKIK